MARPPMIPGWRPFVIRRWIITKFKHDVNKDLKVKSLKGDDDYNGFEIKEKVGSGYS